MMSLEMPRLISSFGDGLAEVLRQLLVQFVSILLQADTEEGKQACEDLGIDVIPTVQFWQGEQFLWEHRGYLQLDQNLGDGMEISTPLNSFFLHAPQSNSPLDILSARNGM